MSALHQRTIESPFVGRSDLTEELNRRLGSGTFLTLVGAPGVGKTRLATEFGNDSESWRTRFCSLSSATDEAEALSAIAAALEVGSNRTRSKSDLVDLVRRALGIPGTLLILDNAEHLTEQVADFFDEVGEFSAAVLATSRKPIGAPAEETLDIETLDIEAGIELFASRYEYIWQDGPAPEDKEVIREIVERLDGLPLAIELVASRSDIMTPRELNDRLEATSLDFDSLSATIQWSWELLSDEERKLLAGLSVFRGPFSLEAIEAVIEGATPDAVSALARHSLIRNSRIGREIRFTLLHGIRVFAASHLEDQRHDELLRRHAAYYGNHARRLSEQLKGADGLDAIGIIKVDLENIEAVIRRQQYAEASDVVGAIVGLGNARLVVVASPLDEYIAWSEAVLERIETPAEKIRLQTMIARFQRLAAEPKKALLIASRAAVEADEIDVRIDALRTAGIAGLEVGDLDRALSFFEEAIQLAEAEDDKFNLGGLHQNMASIRLAEGNFSQARKHASIAYGLLSEASSPPYSAIALCNLSMCHLMLDENREALKCATEAADSFSTFGSRFGRGLTVNMKAEALYGIGRVEEALECAREAARIHGEVGVRTYVLSCRVVEAMCLIRLKKPEEAGRILEAVLTAPERGQVEVSAWLWLGISQICRNQISEAVETLEKALDQPVGFGIRDRIHGYLAAAYALAGEEVKAQEQLDAARKEMVENDPSAEVFELFLFLGAARQAFEASDRETTRSLVERVRTSLDSLDGQAETASLVDALFVARRALENLTRGTEEKVPPIRIARDGRTVVLPDGEELDLSRRRSIPGILVELTRARIESPGTEVDQDPLVEAGWPGEHMTFESGKKRLHTAIWTLRKLGLDETIITYESGYLFDPEVRVSWLS